MMIVTPGNGAALRYRTPTGGISEYSGSSGSIARLWAVLDASRRWRGLTMSPRVLRGLQDLARQRLHPPAEEVIDEAVTAAA
jgi:hypothetical protein